MAEEELPDDLVSTGVPEQPVGSKDQQSSGPGLTDRIQDAQNQYQNFQDAKDLFNKGKAKLAAKKGAKEAGKKGLKEGVEKQGANAAKRKVATQGAQQAGKVAAQTGARAAGTAVGEAAVGTGAAVVGAEAGAAAGSVVPIVGTIIGAIVGAALPWLVSKVKKYWKVPVYIIAGLLLLAAVPFGLLSLKDGGQYPSTQAQQNQTIIAAATAGDFVVSGKKIGQKTLEAEEARYKTVLSNLKQNNPTNLNVATVEVKINEILTLLKQGVGLSGQAKKNMTASIKTKVEALDATLPFGEWIAKAAEGQAGKPSGNFCRRGVPGSLGCASFVTSVLYSAGVPQPYKPDVDSVWRMSFYRVIVDRPQTKSAAYYDQNKSNLRRGDIIFWGDGNCSKGGSKYFDHIGFYLGNGLSIDNSSGNTKKGIPPHVRNKPILAADRDYGGKSCRVFNGAKRYGANL